MSEEKWKGYGSEAGDARHQHEHRQPDPQYGTFSGVPSHQPPAIGFPQPVPPPGAMGHPPPGGPTCHPHGYQAVPAYPVPAEGRPLREPRLPCCGIGLGWFLFIVGFFLAAIPWYVGAFVLLCVRRFDYREKPGYIACTIAVSASIC
ncbi:60S ribosomal protein L18a-1 [Apostasia shenzhenica]|uniref:60S ribosomal protein L18a-1 n=1 Tax=Apostasia shenzhenica TaxID=1088818 RepID=A0A2I0B3Y3_9ASPA|nr:60S ribosomal protein L18a-1 [Apostasia shenzhenica]